MPITDVITLADNTTTKSHIKRGEKAFYGVRLEEDEKLCLSLAMKGDLTAKIYFKNRRLLIKTMRSGNHDLIFSAPQAGFYQCILETIEGANYTLHCDIDSATKARKDTRFSIIKKISLKNLFVILPLFVLPSLMLFLFLGKFSIIFLLPFILGIYLFHETREEKQALLHLLYATNVVFAFLIVFYVYFILGWHDVERFLLAVIYLLAFMLALATFHLFLRKILGYGK